MSLPHSDTQQEKPSEDTVQEIQPHSHEPSRSFSGWVDPRFANTHQPLPSDFNSWADLDPVDPGSQLDMTLGESAHPTVLSAGDSALSTPVALESGPAVEKAGGPLSSLNRKVGSLTRSGTLGRSSTLGRSGTLGRSSTLGRSGNSLNRRTTTKSDHAHPNVPSQSYASMDDQGVRTNLGHTNLIMAILSELWLVSTIVIVGATYLLTFYNWLPGSVPDDYQLWNTSCYWKLGLLLPLPYTLICFLGLALPFRTPKFIYNDSLRKRKIDNLYILTVTKGDNRDAVYRSWNAHKHLERLDPCVRVHVLTDEPYFFENINCYTCPKSFATGRSKYKARALEWYRQTMKFTERDWVLHLDEESVIDDESVRRVLRFIWYEHDCTWGQGVILYNQYNYWKNWIYTVADALRVGDDVSRFQLQYTYFKRPIFGAHGSFLLTNGAVENAVTWDLGSLTEDYQFAMVAWKKGFKCGKVPAIIREQSPMRFIDFLKQRRRWYVGIRRLPQFLPRVWAFFWTLSVVSVLSLIATTILGFVMVQQLPDGTFQHYTTPRWFVFLTNFSWVVFMYLYLIGNFIQDLDKGANIFLVIARIPVTLILQLIASLMEAAAVLYGIVDPPKDFDVIKK
ncbi:glycosyl transferase family group 2-domain-containing protein [Polychytrium aggregatum]|uniref:glycosyl transferase family group 2-domain-containing protein n=1 Tax=Polychytrium aggregatum TaxID=110093 RepID=UPI0022FDE2C6|nr:glycosyl transferase family group 2-domain-containing protein [Polychytrium aggregatum]KAI9193277.1 glycosyl transferase family group 2-domain-containing protein [Polychytrium aggregatum]